jgi:hypothetical protein
MGSYCFRLSFTSTTSYKSYGGSICSPIGICIDPFRFRTSSQSDFDYIHWPFHSLPFVQKCLLIKSSIQIKYVKKNKLILALLPLCQNRSLFRLNISKYCAISKVCYTIALVWTYSLTNRCFSTFVHG